MEFGISIIVEVPRYFYTKAVEYLAWSTYIEYYLSYDIPMEINQY